jgi:hypothetical protein
MNMHRGYIHKADLGDGLGKRPEQYLARQHYFPVLGSCWESLAGGNHFRAWKQNGTEANTGAWFLAVSKEKYLGEHHTIDDDGYNKGRDWLVERALKGGGVKGKSWIAEIDWRVDLLEAGWKGINHGIAQDGRVAVLTVRELEE